jgi:hypothetical protein
VWQSWRCTAGSLMRWGSCPPRRTTRRALARAKALSLHHIPQQPHRDPAGARDPIRIAPVYLDAVMVSPFFVSQQYVPLSQPSRAPSACCVRSLPLAPLTHPDQYTRWRDVRRRKGGDAATLFRRDFWPGLGGLSGRICCSWPCRGWAPYRKRSTCSHHMSQQCARALRPPHAPQPACR